MQDLSKVSVVLPSLDPDEKLVAVIDGLLSYGFTHIILVNDGSKKENLHYFEDAAAQHPEITLLHHEVNRGKGAALKTAFTWFLENCPDKEGVVTVDGDNQHHPEDTRNCALRMLETGKVVLGCRDFNQPDEPSRSRHGNHITSWVFKVVCNMTISATQPGLRAIHRKDLEILNQVAGDRFEYETNMLLALKTNGIEFEEVKIRTVYIEENKSSHFRVVRDSWRIYKLILAHFFRYTISSLVGFLVETGVLSGLNLALSSVLSGAALTAATAIPARAISSLVNFFLNKKMVFRTKVSTGKAMIRYYALAIPQMILQFLLDEGAYMLLNVEGGATAVRVLIHIAVMVILYIVSYMIQQRWVFAPEKSNETP